jgi:hypothetical protein
MSVSVSLREEAAVVGEATTEAAEEEVTLEAVGEASMVITIMMMLQSAHQLSKSLTQNMQIKIMDLSNWSQESP